MNNFWDLVRFEYKKIYMKKSTWIAMVLFVVGIVFSCFGVIIGNEYVDGIPVRSHYESMKIDREYDRALAGKEINADLIMDAAKAYQNVPVGDTIRYTETNEYQTHARAYSSIYGIIRTIYNKTAVPVFGYEELQNISPEMAGSFYNYRSSKIKETIEKSSVSNQVKEKLITLDKKVVKPFVFEYYGGYDRFLVLMYTTGLICAFIIAFLIAPIFSGEYQGCDQIILSTKNGKNTLIKAKLFTGFSVTTGLVIAGILLTYIPCMLIYGFDGANTVIQLKYSLITLPLTIGKLSIICSICVFFACIVVGAITMVLSAKLKSPFLVITIITGLIFIPMFIQASNNILPLYRLYLLLPSSMMEYINMIDPVCYEIFGAVLQPYVVMPTVALFISMLLTPFAYRGFKYHQVE